MDSVCWSSDISAIVGKDFPNCQGTHSPLNGKEFPMTDKRPLPRHVLAQNLKALKAKSGLSAPEIARRSKPPVDRKTVTNYLRGETDPRPDKVEAIARGFGLTGAALMSASFQPDMADDEYLPQLLKFWSFANEAGRDLILKVAEAAPRKGG